MFFTDLQNKKNTKRSLRDYNKVDDKILYKINNFKREVYTLTKKDTSQQDQGKSPDIESEPTKEKKKREL